MSKFALNPITGKLQLFPDTMGDLTANASFSVNKNGTIQAGIVSGVWTKVTWAAASFDTSSEFDLAQNRWEPLWNGHALINVSLFYTVSTVADKQLQINLKKDGSFIAPEFNNVSPNFGFAPHVASMIIPIVSGSYYELYARQFFGVNATLSGDSDHTIMQGLRIG